jgi:transposase
MIDIQNLPSNKEALKDIIISLNKKYEKSEIQLQKSEIQLQKSEVELQKSEIELKNKSEEIKTYQDEVRNLNDLIRLLRRQRFAPKSEVIPKEQLRLFNEAETEVDKEVISKEDTEVKSYKRKKPKRKPLPDYLPRKTVVLVLPEEERVCSNDGTELKKIGEEISEQLEIIPAQMKVIRTIRVKYGCKTCNSCIKIAPLPKKPIPKSIATAGLLSFVAVSKYVDGLPLYRIEDILQRNKVDIPRSTMSQWMIKVGELLTPLYNLIQDDLISGNYIACDETRVQVLKEPGKKATTQSFMWVRGRAGPDPIILYDYDPTRSGDVPDKLLEGFKGYLQVDGYSGYNKVCRRKDIIRVGCMAHIRRKFFDALKGSKHGKNKAETAIILIKKLYKIEERIKELPVKEKYEIRQKESKEIMNEFKKFIDKYLHMVPPESLLGKAFLYAHNEWQNVARCLENGKLRIDNNFIENAIRPFAIGRKNWLFSDSVRGAKSSAMIYSIIETAKANGHESYSYIKHILNEIPKAENIEDFEKLLPYKMVPVNIYGNVDN